MEKERIFQVFGQLVIRQFSTRVSQDSAQELFRRIISSYFGVSRIEFQFCFLRIRFVSQGVVCFRSGFGGVVHWIDKPVCSMFFRRQSTERLPSACKVTHEARHLALFPSNNVTRQCTGNLSTHHFTLSWVSRIEFQFCCLRIRFVSQGVFSLTFTVIFLNVSRGSTLFVSLYISFV